MERNDSHAFNEPIRLNRYLAMSGSGSRREADVLIQQGKVKVNGELITQLGTQVYPGDKVTFEGEEMHPEGHQYILLNKPKDFVSTTYDPGGRPTVIDLVANYARARLYPVGRLDAATTGLILLTNDGELTRALTHPSAQVPKLYKVKLDKPLVKADFMALMDGVDLEDGPMAPDEMAYVDDTDRSLVGIKIHSGRNRIIRRLFEAVGYRVRGLDRVVLANLTKKDLPRGQFRELQEREVRLLKSSIPNYRKLANTKQVSPGRDRTNPY